MAFARCAHLTWVLHGCNVGGFCFECESWLISEHVCTLCWKAIATLVPEAEHLPLQSTFKPSRKIFAMENILRHLNRQKPAISSGPCDVTAIHNATPVRSGRESWQLHITRDELNLHPSIVLHVARSITGNANTQERRTLHTHVRICLACRNYYSAAGRPLQRNCGYSSGLQKSPSDLQYGYRLRHLTSPSKTRTE